MLKCSECGRDLPEKEALVNKNEAGEQRIICPECFQKLTGVDYKTFAYRKENAKQTLLAVLFCLGATIYAFMEKGVEWGIGGIVLTILVYLFSSKVK
ncbi:hypothetical protein SAMN05216582_101171 [Selenomonas ruminantium]|uniref:Uncharacterized protein n=1 Tax=Selenomonas ruminantium TaxID=971 RepID=A0A1M6R5Z6_SELRU|nr:hypothetical protein [Selenomonas ruminantium]SHK27891.1 hypothetical protein SAMN05216582_101171 [Selenomonas ruminantium]